VSANATIRIVVVTIYFAVCLALPLGVYGFMIRSGDEASRPVFMMACAGPNWRNNETIRYCDDAWRELAALRARNWKPSP
jgi:hypothetical protein